MIGKTLGGRYSVIRRLGGGGFSDTYLAIDKQLPKTPCCVVKRLKAQSTDTELLKTARRLFSAEATILYELGRKNDQIPRLLAHFEEEKEFYLVQEFIEGKDLSHELTPGRQLSEGQTVALLQDILQVLRFVHQQGVIHRDIKPRNLIRREEDDQIVLIDFGAVKQISTQLVSPLGEGQTTATIAIGTPGYMPNEQQGGKPRFSSDIYAVGMIAIQALTGLSPQKLEEDAHTGEMIWRPHAVVSQELAEIIDRMVRTHFRDRYKSVEEVLIDLYQLQGIALDQEQAFTTALFDQSSTWLTKTKHLRNWRSKILGNRWVMASIAIGCSMVGYGYWHSYSVPGSETTTAQVLPGQAAADRAASPAFNLTRTLATQAGAVLAIAPSPDGKTFVSGSEDKTVKQWDMQTGNLLRTFAGHQAEVAAVAISPDGQLLASGSRDNTVKLWNLKTGELIRSLDHPDWVQSLAFSPDGQMLAAGDRDGTVFVWQVKTGELLCNFVGHTDAVTSVAISADGKLLASGSNDKTIRVVSLETEKRIHLLAQHAGEVKSVVISPDGQTLVSGGIDKIFIWNLKTGQVVRTLPSQSSAVRSLAISPDGKTLVSSHQDNAIKLWNLQTGDLMRTLTGHLDSVLSVAVSLDNKTILSGGRDTTIKIWQQL